jgi:bifunctional non-homologous end joining protein LigD
MLAALDDPPIKQRGYIYEPKFDGIRALADVAPPAGRGAAPHVAIYSRNGNDKTAQFPAIAKTLAAIARRLEGPVLLDGEIVALDPQGRALGFQHIQGRIHLTGAADILRAERDQPAAFLVFDLLRDGDDDLRGQPLAARRLRLQDRIRPRAAEREIVRLTEIVPDDGTALLERATREGWEGLIVKDGQSVYQSGRRSPAWRKKKLLKQQEFVVGGWTEPRSTRTHFGSLLLGYYDASGALRWAGSVGTGFDQAELDRVFALLKPLEIPKSPFADVVRPMEKPHWVTPTIVAEARFTEWTADGMLRQPVYLGTRDDKSAGDIRRESPARTTVAPELAALIERLQELEDAKKDGDLTLPNGDVLRVTNLAKPFWKKLGLTKGDLLRYYVEVSPFLLPAVHDRPLVMKRFPNGIDGQAFYQQRHPETPPPGVRRETLPDDVEPIDEEEGPRDRLIGGSLTTLLYMTQLAAISQDPWFSTVADPMHPDQVAIDLDPGEGATFSTVVDVARWVKDELDRYGIPGVPKTSGSRGLHIYIPLPPGTTYDVGQLLCEVIATVVATKHPKSATVERWVKRRPRGTIYVDYLQNILGKTLATAYSARASDFAGVSTPLAWKEIDERLDPRAFTIRTAPARFSEVGDLWARIRTGKPVDLKSVLARLK